MYCVYMYYMCVITMCVMSPAVTFVIARKVNKTRA